MWPFHSGDWLQLGEVGLRGLVPEAGEVLIHTHLFQKQTIAFKVSKHLLLVHPDLVPLAKKQNWSLRRVMELFEHHPGFLQCKCKQALRALHSPKHSCIIGII